MNKQTSQQIGASLEKEVRDLLDQWAVEYRLKPRFRTIFGTDIELDYLLPATKERPPVVLECKNFAVDAKNPEDSKRQKTQEALWLLIQVKKYCAETAGARLILITGQTNFRGDQIDLLKHELGEDFHIVPIAEKILLRQLLGLSDRPLSA
ncbi:MAG: hypothetical protein D6690_00040 [Nitrospirae bacterium]|nr:MAG: hypothetical protein D6690_00040 [Nitrospirota bacterium]